MFQRLAEEEFVKYTA
ncbi:hypothetical protein [Enterococcus italicus]|nr:hypothetical protein [Enterococcus italicus]